MVVTQTVPPATNAAQNALPVAPRIARLVPYHPGKPVEEVEREFGLTGIVKLASNENALGPSPQAMEAMTRQIARMHVYPDADSYTLRHALSAFLDVAPDALVFGNGSDDVIHLLGITFLEPGDEVIQADPSFVRYEAAAILNNAVCHLVPLTSDWVHDLDAMAARLTSRTRLIFIANPNNPTGTIVTASALERFFDAVPERALVVLDEAYCEYATHDPAYPNALRYVREDRNVVVLRTFSKAYGLAGLRIGYGVMPPRLAQWLNRTREPFNVNQMAQVAATAALSDTEHIRRSQEMNALGKQAFYATFAELGLPYVPTWGNFVWVDTRRESRAVFQALLHKGVITRTGDPFGAPTHLRVTIGTEAENAKFLTALREVLPTL